MVKLTDGLRVVGVTDRTQFDHGIIIEKVHQAARTHHEARDYLAAIACLARSGNHASFHQIKYPVRKHFAMYAQVVPVGQGLQDGIGNSAYA